MAAKIRNQMKKEVPLVEIFKASTIEKLAEYIRKTGNEGLTLPAGYNNLALLKKRPGSGNHLFFIHDASGEVDGYIEFCNHSTGAFNFWGIKAQKITGYAPRNLSIEEVARSYVETMKSIQLHGPYCIAGWSIGGTIGFEMVRQLEQRGEETGFLALIDTLPPNQDVPGRGMTFNLESELKLIRRYFLGRTVEDKIENIDEIGIDQVWSEVMEYLEESEFNIKRIKDSVPGDFARLIPIQDFAQIGIKELIYYLNMVRTLDNARNKYIPVGKINAPVHFFKAGKMENIDTRKWNGYCKGPIRIYEIPGDHFSIFKNPGVVTFAKLFDEIIQKINKG